MAKLRTLYMTGIDDALNMRVLPISIILIFVFVAVLAAEGRRHHKKHYSSGYYLKERGIGGLLTGGKKDETKGDKSLLEKLSDQHQKKKEENMTFMEKVKSRTQRAITKGAVKKFLGK
ncbi:hypothetical protein ACTXT7_014068 [Hymenolepis weldensis]